MLLCVTLFALSFVASAADKPAKPVTVEQIQAAYRAEAVETVKRAVTGAMKDPDSVKFRNVAADKSGAFVCGEVNAKNAMGGYSGYTPFYGDGRGMLRIKAESMTDGEKAAFDAMSQATCPQ